MYTWFFQLTPGVNWTLGEHVLIEPTQIEQDDSTLVEQEQKMTEWVFPISSRSEGEGISENQVSFEKATVFV